MFHKPRNFGTKTASSMYCELFMPLQSHKWPAVWIMAKILVLLPNMKCTIWWQWTALAQLDWAYLELRLAIFVKSPCCWSFLLNGFAIPPPPVKSAVPCKHVFNSGWWRKLIATLPIGFRLWRSYELNQFFKVNQKTFHLIISYCGERAALYHYYCWHPLVRVF